MRHTSVEVYLELCYCLHIPIKRASAANRFFMKRHNKGFVLVQVALYGIMTALCLSFFLFNVRLFMRWYTHTRHELESNCYHYSNALAVYADCICAEKIDTSVLGTITVSGARLTSQWHKSPWIKKYTCTSEGLYCTHIHTNEAGVLVQSSLYKGPCPFALRYQEEAGTRMLFYEPQEGIVWRYQWKECSP